MKQEEIESEDYELGSKMIGLRTKSFSLKSGNV